MNNSSITSPQSSSVVLTTLNLIAEALVKSPINTTSKAITYSGSNMAFGLKTIPQNHTGPVTTIINDSEQLVSVNFETKNNHEDAFGQNISSENFRLPEELFREAPEHVFTYVLKDGSMFVSNHSRHGNKTLQTKRLAGHVISISLLNKSVSGLSNPIEYSTWVLDIEEGMNETCGFWKIEGIIWGNV